MHRYPNARYDTTSSSISISISIIISSSKKEMADRTKSLREEIRANDCLRLSNQQWQWNFILRITF
jgi:hypothetical protein